MFQVLRIEGSCWACGRSEDQEHHSWCRGLWMQETAPERELDMLIRQQKWEMKKRNHEDREYYYDSATFKQTGRNKVYVVGLPEKFSGEVAI